MKNLCKIMIQDSKKQSNLNSLQSSFLYIHYTYLLYVVYIFSSYNKLLLQLQQSPLNGFFFCAKYQIMYNIHYTLYILSFTLVNNKLFTFHYLLLFEYLLLKLLLFAFVSSVIIFFMENCAAYLHVKFIFLVMSDDIEE